MIKGKWAKLAGAAGIVAASYAAPVAGQAIEYRAGMCPVGDDYSQGFVRALNDWRIEHRLASGYVCSLKNSFDFEAGYIRGNNCVTSRSHDIIAQMRQYQPQGILNTPRIVERAVDDCHNWYFGIR